MACTSLQMINANLDAEATATIVTAFDNLVHNQPYNLCYLVGWTSASGAERLQIQVGATGSSPVPNTYPVLNSQGQPVLIGTLRQERRLCLKFVNPNSSPTVIPAHFVLGNSQCPQIIVTRATITTSAVSPNPPSQPAGSTGTGSGGSSSGGSSPSTTPPSGSSSTPSGGSTTTQPK